MKIKINIKLNMFRSLILPKAGVSLQRTIHAAAASTGAIINFRTNNIIEFCSSSATAAISSASSTTCLFKPCGIQFQQQQQPPTSSFMCPVCQRQFKSQVGLSDHILAKHGEDLKKAQQQKLNQQPNADSTPASTSTGTPTTVHNPPPPTTPVAPSSSSSSSFPLPTIENPTAPPIADGTAAANTAEPAMTSVFKCEHCNKTFKSREGGIAHIKDKHKELLSRAHQAYKEQLVTDKKEDTTATSTEEVKPASAQ